MIESQVKASREAVQASYTKPSAQDVANYFLYLDASDDNADGISHLKMQKLVYYAYGFYYALFGERLFAEQLRAWQHGPVSYSLAQIYRACGRNAIAFSEDMRDATALSPEQEDFLQQLYREYSQYSAWKLSEMTHQEKPWRNGIASGFINDADVLEHFEKVIALNETEALLEACPDIRARIAEAEQPDFVGVAHEDLMQELGIAL